MKIRKKVAVGLSSLLTVLALGLATAPVEAATPTPTPNVTVFPNFYYYKLINISTFQNWVNYTPVASCGVGSNGITCTISRETALGTTIQTALGYAVKGVSATLGFSLTRTSATGVACTSPRMNVGQRFVAYAVGIEKEYRIQKWADNSDPYGPPPHVVATSGYLFSWTPYPYPAIQCQVE